MSGEKLGSFIEGQGVSKTEENKVQFTQAGSPSLFSIEDFAASLDDNLRDILSRVRPLEQKRDKVLQTEREHDMPIELLIFRFYWVENKSTLGSGQIIDLSTEGVRKIMQRAGIPRRDISTARKVQYCDPLRKQELLAGIHSSQANRMRSMTLARFHKEHPDVSRKMQKNAVEARRKRLAQQEQEALGLYPSFDLFQLHYTEGYSVREISQKTGLPESRVRGLMDKYGVNNLDKPYEREGKHLATVNKSIDVFYKKEARLTPKEEYIIYRRYINPEYNLVTLKEVGNDLGVTREDIRQIEERAISKLRDFMPRPLGSSLT